MGLHMLPFCWHLFDALLHKIRLFQFKNNQVIILGAPVPYKIFIVICSNNDSLRQDTKNFKNKYSRTSVVLTLIARLPWLF